MSGWRLYTGITGLLGQYLLCDALRRREPIVVFARSRRQLAAVDRVERVITAWENQLGVSLQRPIVLSGDLRLEGLGLSSVEAKWCRQHVSSIVHCAASVIFEQSPSGEPLKSNVDGTRHLLQFCRESSVQEFHYISTAYSCGVVEGLGAVLETLHSQIGPFRNIYERSKCIAEHLVIESEGEFSRTIYRPSVIAGESKSGYSPSFNAIYTPLQLAWMLVQESPQLVRSKDDLLGPLGLRGNELRNIVPIDWVSQSIGSIVRNPTDHGGIYHLTNPVPTNGEQILSAMIQGLSEVQPGKPKRSRYLGEHASTSLSAFVQHMEGFRSYFQSDPAFDNSRFRAVSSYIPCPSTGEEFLTRAFKFAIQNQFKASESEDDIVHEFEPRRRLDKLMAECERSNSESSLNNSACDDHGERPDNLAFTPDELNRKESVNPLEIHLTLSGPGGGCWTIFNRSQGICCIRPETDSEAGTQVYASAATFRSWLEGLLSFEDGLRHSLFIVTGKQHDAEAISQLMFELRSNQSLMNPTNSGGLEPRQPDNHQVDSKVESVLC